MNLLGVVPFIIVFFNSDRVVEVQRFTVDKYDMQFLPYACHTG